MIRDIWEMGYFYWGRYTQDLCNQNPPIVYALPMTSRAPHVGRTPRAMWC